MTSTVTLLYISIAKSNHWFSLHLNKINPYLDGLVGGGVENDLFHHLPIGLHHHLDLEELRNVEERGEDDDRQEIRDKDPFPRIDTDTLVVVFDRPPNSPISFQGQSHGEEDGTAKDKVVQLVESVSECVLVDLIMGAAFAKGLQNAAQDVEVVVNGQEDEESIKNG